MKTENDTDAAAQPTAEQPWPKIAVKLLGSTDESHPTITCECALWGSPCPHFFWSEKDATTAISM